MLLFFPSFAAATRVNFIEDFRFMPLPEKKILRSRIQRMIAIEHNYINVIGGGSLVTAYIVYLLYQHKVQGQMYLDVFAEEPETFFIVMSWTCLLLIRASRLVYSTVPPRPRGRAQFEGILGPFTLLLLLLLFSSNGTTHIIGPTLLRFSSGSRKSIACTSGSTLF